MFSHATRRGMVISHIYVDDEQSLSGGREIWGLPKELATFEYGPTHFKARQGETLLEARIRRRRGRIGMLVPAPIVSEAGATLGRAKIKAAPGAGHARRSTAQPVRDLGLSGTHLALAGDDLRLTMPPPK